MKLLYAHDHILQIYNNEVYSNGSFSTEIFERYAEVFPEITFLSRQAKLNIKPDKLTVASHNKVKFVKVPNPRTLSNINKIIDIKNLVKKSVADHDYIIARLPSTIGELAVYFAKKLNKPYMIEVVACAWDSNINHGSLSGKLFAPIEYAINKKYIKNADYVTYITKEFLQKRYPTKANYEICPNVLLNPVQNEVLNKRLEKIALNNSSLNLGLIGSLDVNYKGHDTLIKAIAIVKKKYPNVKIEFLGKGNASRWRNMIIEKNIEYNVVFKGTLPSGKEVYNWIDNIDMLIQPSSAEAQGRSIIEAMSRGCPVLSTKVGGVPELLNDRQLIKVGDYKHLAIMIIKCITEKEILREEAIRNFHEAKQFYKKSIDVKRFQYLKKFKNNHL